MYLSQRARLILDMLQYIEHASGADAARSQTDVLQSGTDHRIETTLPGCARPVNTWFDNGAGKSGLRKSFGNVPIATANIEERTLRGEAARYGCNAAVPVAEPK